MVPGPGLGPERVGANSKTWHLTGTGCALCFPEADVQRATGSLGTARNPGVEVQQPSSQALQLPS